MTLNLINIKTEIVYFLKNADILTITQRGVTTYSDTGTFAGALTHTLGNSPTAVKNVRSVVVGGTTLTYGEDYTLAYATGVITFTVAQTGVYTISYDSGTGDSIYPDFPRDDLDINSYPRIAVDFSGIPSDAFGIGGSVYISSPTFEIIIYADKTRDIDTYTQSIKDAMQTNAKLFNYARYTKLTFIGPVIESPERKAEIMHRNMEYEIMFQTH